MHETAGSQPPSTAPGATRPAHGFLESKLRRPPGRHEWVQRSRLLDKLDDAVARPITLVAAPAGFGKTTVLVQWVESRRAAPSTVWVALDTGDNDPVRMWTHIATALERAGCQFGRRAASLVSATSDDITQALLPRLIRAMAALPEDLVLVLEDFHLVNEPVCHAQVEFLMEHLPPRAHLVIATRADPGLRLGRLRASGQLGEVRAADLAFSTDEATSLLAVERVQLSPDGIRDLVQRTEGWPAGLYLARLSLSGHTDPDAFVRQFSGDNRFVGDYLSEEVLGRQTDQVREFITAISILDWLSPPLCDYVTETSSSAAVLRELERTNMFLVALDEKRQWYRLHHLFAAAARSELEIEQPDRVPALHARAGAWFREHGYVDQAIAHLLLAERTEETAALVQAHWLKYVGAGRTATVEGWLSALGPPSVSSDPAAGVTAAWMAATTGDVAGLRRHAEALEEFQHHGPLPDGTHSVESALAMIQGLFGFDGATEMTRGAQRAVELETDGQSPYYSMALVARGHAAYVTGDLDQAALLLARATQNSAVLPVIRVLGCALHSLVEAEKGDQARAEQLAQLAMSVVEAGTLQTVPQASMAFTALARARLAAGDLAEAVSLAEYGLGVRRRNPSLSPWPTLHHLIAHARIASRAGDPEIAGALADEAEQMIERFPDAMVAMRARLDAARPRTPQRPSSLVDEPLTDREVEVLRMLRGSLSLHEIADQLFVSRNTVKSHTRALYRKLGAASRADALHIARDRGLL